MGVTLELLQPTCVYRKERDGRGQKYKETEILTTSFRYEINLFYGHSPGTLAL